MAAALRAAPARWRGAALLALVALAGTVQAEPAYVIDKLLVGVHEKPSLDSPIVKVLKTGTRLEVLEREGDLARVKGEGVEGWVDGAYLMAEEPAAVKLAALEKELAALRAGAGGEAPASEIDVLTRENTELKGMLSDERIKVRDLTARIAALESADGGPPASDAEAALRAEVTALNASKLALERELENTLRELRRARRAELGEALGLGGIEPSGTAVAVFVLIVAAAFGAGAYVMDYLQRRRHGGFRV